MIKKSKRRLQRYNNHFPLNLPMVDIDLLKWKKGDFILIQTDFKKEEILLKRLDTNEKNK